jgi:hypothetical protein
MAKYDAMLERIRAFNRTRGGGVVAERVNKGYSLFSAATGAPIARLRPTGTGDEVEVFWWRRETPCVNPKQLWRGFELRGAGRVDR